VHKIHHIFLTTVCSLHAETFQVFRCHSNFNLKNNKMQTDSMTHCVSRNLVYSCTTIRTSCMLNPEQIEVMQLEGYSPPMTRNKLCASGHDVSTIIGVSHKLSRVFLTTPSTCCHGKIFQVQYWGQSCRRKYPSFWRYHNFLTTQCRTCGRKLPCQKAARFVHLF